MDVYSLMASISLDTTEYESGLKKAKQQGKTFSNDFAQKYTTAFEKGAKTLAKWGAAIGGAATAATGFAVKIGSSFESAMSETQAIFGIADKTSDAYQKLEATAREYGKSTQYSASESTNALKYMALAGWDVQQSTSALPGVLNLAAAASMDLAQASDMVTDYMSAFGIEADKSTYFADALAYAQNHANTTVDQLGQAFQNCAANMNASGQDFETTTALLEGMANQGTKGSLAGTQLAAMMRDLTAKMKNGSISIGNTKIAVQDANGNFRDMTDILKDVSTATDGMGDAQRATALSSVFTADSLKGVNLILNEGVDNIAQYEEELRKSKGTAEEAARVNNDNLAGALKKLRSATDEVGIAFYKKFQEPLTTAIEKISDAVSNFDIDAFLQKVSGVLEKLKAFAPAITAIAGGLTGLYGVLKVIDFSKGVGDTIAAISKAGGIISALGGPIGIIVTLIAAVVAWLVTLYATNEEFRNKVNEVWSAVTETISGAVEAIGTFFTDTIPNAINSVIEWFQQLPERISEFMANAVQSVADWAEQTAENARQAGEQFLQNVIEFFTQLPGNVLNFLTTTIQNVVSWAGQMKQNAIETGSQFLQSVIEFFTQLPGKVAEWFTQTIEKVVEWASEMKEKGGQAAKDLLDAVVTGLQELPSKVFEMGVNAAKSLLDGIKSMAGWLKEQVGSFVNGIVSGFTGTIQTNGSHAGGMDYVPFNGYVASLHRGEMVLTAKEADSYRRGEKAASSGGVTVVQYIYSQAKTAAELMREAQYEQRRALMMNAI